MDRVTVACVQAEPVILDRSATLDKLERLAAEVRARGASVALFPETFVPFYPSSRWARYLAHWDGNAKATFARLAQESVDVPGPDADRIAAVARDNELWLGIGVNERDSGTIYNALLLFSPQGELVLHHRKLMPTNHERLVWGLGDGSGLEAVATDVGKIGGLICWENFMPLARFALYESGVQIYLAPTADDSEEWHVSMQHIARESRAYVLSCCVFQRASSFPSDVELADGDELVGRGGSAILAPDGSYLAGPLWDEEGILVAELDGDRLYAERQRFDPAGHYHRPDVFSFGLTRR